MGDEGAFSPDWVVAPGEVIDEMLRVNNLAPDDLAARMGVPVTTVDALLAAEQPVTPELAKKLQDALGVVARVWLNLESHYSGEPLPDLREQPTMRRRRGDN